ELPLLSPRGALFLALEHERDALRAQADDLARRGASFEVMSAGEVLKVCPVIRTEKFAQGLYEPGCMDIDTNALMNGYGRALRRRGSQVLLNSRVGQLAREAAGWCVWTGQAELCGAIVINAAGGWVQHVARMAGLGYRNVVPFRRTAVTFDSPPGSDIRTW